MSSTSQTENVGLNQWAASDPVLREDFNADNLKLDNAIGGLSMVKLLDFTSQADGESLSLDLSGIDFSKYACLKIYPFIRHSTGGNVKLLLNGIEDYVYSYCANTDTASSGSYNDLCSIMTSNGSARCGETEITLCCQSGAALFGVKSMSISSNGAIELSSCVCGVSPSTLALEDVETLDFKVTAGLIVSGSRCLVCGVKK